MVKDKSCQKHEWIRLPEISKLINGKRIILYPCKCKNCGKEIHNKFN